MDNVVTLTLCSSPRLIKDMTRQEQSKLRINESKRNTQTHSPCEREMCGNAKGKPQVFQTYSIYGNFEMFINLE
jgi:hypothetical protein